MDYKYYDFELIKILDKLVLSDLKDDLDFSKLIALEGKYFSNSDWDTLEDYEDLNDPCTQRGIVFIGLQLLNHFKGNSDCYFDCDF